MNITYDVHTYKYICIHGTQYTFEVTPKRITYVISFKDCMHIIIKEITLTMSEICIYVNNFINLSQNISGFKLLYNLGIY